MPNPFHNPYAESELSSNNWDLINGETVEKDLSLSTDVIIVGTGAGGGITAEILSKAGLKVIMIEEGPLRHSDQFKMMEKFAYPDLYQEAAARKTADKAINIMQGRTVGGSTTVNWTSSFRTPEQTLAHWQKEHGVKGITEQSMKPWFEWAEKRLNIHPWQMPPNKNNQILKDGMEKLGYHAKVISRNVKGCANLGYCGMGCPINAKQSMLVSTIPTALNNGATLLSRTRVNQLIFDTEKVTGVAIQFMDSQGQLRQRKGLIHAKHVVLSAGAIGTPAILMRSKIPDPYQLIGKRTFIHPVNLTAAIYNEKIEAASGAPQSIYSDTFQWPSDNSIGFKLEVPPMHPLLTATMMNGFGEEHANMMQNFSHFQSILALLRDGFHEQSTGGEVKLDNNLYPVLDYPISQYLWDGIKKSYAVMMEVQFATGAQQVIPLHQDAQLVKNWYAAKKLLQTLPMKPLRAKLFTAHLMGGCPLGSSEKMSVVNNSLQHHQLEGLSIIDGSVFPTSLGVNPQLSIYGMSARAATLLSESLVKK